MKKRERENPCMICGHYHKYEQGEVCGICGHKMINNEICSSIQVVNAFPSEILSGFLYLGSYDNASRSELLKAQGISRILNTIPSCQNLYKNSFVYHSLEDDKSLQFDNAIQFLEQCEREKARVLVHCMSGKSRSPAIVIAYLMKHKGWRLAQSYQWVKERRPIVELNEVVSQQLQEYEQKVFGSSEATSPAESFSFGFTKNDAVPAALPAFNTNGGSSILDRQLEVPQQFAFGAGHRIHPSNPGISDCLMDGA